MNIQQLLAHVGNPRGHFAAKENRAAKLVLMWPDIKKKMETLLLRGGGTSETARHAYGVLLMMETGIRIGNESSAEGFVCENKFSPYFGQTVKTYGLTTLLGQHVRLEDGDLFVDFVGKKGVEQCLRTDHPLLVKHLPDVFPTQPLLNITENSLRKFIHRYIGGKFKAKDLRTAKVNIEFAKVMSSPLHGEAFLNATSKSGRKKAVANAIEEVAQFIGHTKGVCRSAYISCHVLTFLTLTPQV